MKLATEVSIFVKILRVAVILLALGAVALFGRMAPAIEDILSDNVITIAAAEDMLAALAVPDLGDDEEERFLAALAEARQNVTEKGETPLLEKIEARWRGAFAGSSVDRGALIEAIRELARLNRASMKAADLDASRLGTAGGWAVVLLSLLILGITHIFEVRLEAQVVDPLSAIEETVNAAEAGAIHRRCAERGPPEVRRIAAGLNRLLDLAARWRSSGPDRRPAGERALLTHLLDGRDGEWVAVDEDDQVLFASNAAWSRLQGEASLPEGAHIYAEEIVVPEALRLVRLDGDGEAPLERVESTAAQDEGDETSAERE